MVHREHQSWVGNSEPNLFLCSANRTRSLFHPWQYFLMVPVWTISKLPCSSAPVPPVSSGTGRNGAWWAVMQMCCCSSWSLQCEESAGPGNLPSHSVWCGVFGIFWYIYGLFSWTCEFRGLQRGTGIALCGAYTAKSLLGSSGQKKIICMIFLFLLVIFKLMDITEREHLKLLTIHSA